MNYKRINVWTLSYCICYQMLFLITLGKGDQSQSQDHEQTTHKSGLLSSSSPHPYVPSPLPPINVNLEHLEVTDSPLSQLPEFNYTETTTASSDTAVVDPPQPSNKTKQNKPKGTSKRKLIKFSRNNSTISTAMTEPSPVKFKKQSPFKGITDLIKYGLKKDYFESRTGMLLFVGITALEILTASTMFFGTTGALIAGLVLMIYML